MREKLGVDLYPGAQAVKNGAATATFAGNIHTASATLQEQRSVDQVAAFYKAKFPSAMVSTSDQNRCTIIANNQKNMTTINIQAHDGQTKTQLNHAREPPRWCDGLRGHVELRF